MNPIYYTVPPDGQMYPGVPYYVQGPPPPHSYHHGNALYFHHRRPPPSPQHPIFHHNIHPGPYNHVHQPVEYSPRRQPHPQSPESYRFSLQASQAIPQHRTSPILPHGGSFDAYPQHRIPPHVGPGVPDPYHFPPHPGQPAQSESAYFRRTPPPPLPPPTAHDVNRVPLPPLQPPRNPHQAQTALSSARISPPFQVPPRLKALGDVFATISRDKESEINSTMTNTDYTNKQPENMAAGITNTTMQSDNKCEAKEASKDIKVDDKIVKTENAEVELDQDKNNCNNSDRIVNADDNEVDDYDDCEIEIEEHEFLSSAFECKSYTDSECESADEENDLETTAEDKHTISDVSKTKGTDKGNVEKVFNNRNYLDELHNKMTLEEVAAIIVKDVISRAILFVEKDSKCHDYNQNSIVNLTDFTENRMDTKVQRGDIHDNILHDKDYQKDRDPIHEKQDIDVSNNHSDDIGDQSLESRPRLYSWTYKDEMERKKEGKAEAKTNEDGEVNSSDIKPSVVSTENTKSEVEQISDSNVQNIQIPVNTKKKDDFESFYFRQKASICGIIIESPTKLTQERERHKSYSGIDENKTATDKLKVRRVLSEESYSDNIPVDGTSDFRKRFGSISASSDSGSDVYSLDGSQSDAAVDDFKQKASRRGIRIVDPNDTSDFGSETEFESESQGVHLSKSNRASPIYQNTSFLNPDVPEFKFKDPSLPIKVESNQVTNTLNPASKVFRPRASNYDNIVPVTEMWDDSNFNQSNLNQSQSNLNQSLDMWVDAPEFVPSQNSSVENSFTDYKPKSIMPTSIVSTLDVHQQEFIPRSPASNSASMLSTLKLPKQEFIPSQRPSVSSSYSSDKPQDTKPKSIVLTLKSPKTVKPNPSIATQASPTITDSCVGTRRIRTKECAINTGSCDTRDVSVNTDSDNKQDGQNVIISPRKGKMISKSTNTGAVGRRSVGVNVKFKIQTKVGDKKDAGNMTDAVPEQSKDTDKLTQQVRNLQMEVMQYKTREMTTQLLQQREQLVKQCEGLMPLFSNSNELDVVRGMIENRIIAIEKSVAVIQVEAEKVILKIQSGEVLEELPDLSKFQVPTTLSPPSSVPQTYLFPSYTSPSYYTNPLLGMNQAAFGNNALLGQSLSNPATMATAGMGLDAQFLAAVTSYNAQYLGVPNLSNQYPTAPDNATDNTKVVAAVNRNGETKDKINDVSKDNNKAKTSSSTDYTDIKSAVVTPKDGQEIMISSPDNMYTTKCISSKLSSSPRKAVHTSPIRLPVLPDAVAAVGDPSRTYPVEPQQTGQLKDVLAVARKSKSRRVEQTPDKNGNNSNNNIGTAAGELKILMNITSKPLGTKPNDTPDTNNIKATTTESYPLASQQLEQCKDEKGDDSKGNTGDNSNVSENTVNTPEKEEHDTNNAIIASPKNTEDAHNSMSMQEQILQKMKAEYLSPEHTAATSPEKSPLKGQKKVLSAMDSIDSDEDMAFYNQEKYETDDRDDTSKCEDPLMNITEKCDKIVTNSEKCEELDVNTTEKCEEDEHVKKGEKCEENAVNNESNVGEISKDERSGLDWFDIENLSQHLKDSLKGEYNRCSTPTEDILMDANKKSFDWFDCDDALDKSTETTRKTLRCDKNAKILKNDGAKAEETTKNGESNVNKTEKCDEHKLTGESDTVEIGKGEKSENIEHPVSMPLTHESQKAHKTAPPTESSDKVSMESDMTLPNTEDGGATDRTNEEKIPTDLDESCNINKPEGTHDYDDTKGASETLDMPVESNGVYKHSGKGGMNDLEESSDEEEEEIDKLNDQTETDKHVEKAAASKALTDVEKMLQSEKEGNIPDRNALLNDSGNMATDIPTCTDNLPTDDVHVNGFDEDSKKNIPMEKDDSDKISENNSAVIDGHSANIVPYIDTLSDISSDDLPAPDEMTNVTENRDLSTPEIEVKGANADDPEEIFISPPKPTREMRENLDTNNTLAVTPCPVFTPSIPPPPLPGQTRIGIIQDQPRQPPMVGGCDPGLYQAVLGQLMQAYPHLAGNQVMLTNIAMQQTQLLQMYMKDQQAAGVANVPNNGQNIPNMPNLMNIPPPLQGCIPGSMPQFPNISQNQASFQLPNLDPRQTATVTNKPPETNLTTISKDQKQVSNDNAALSKNNKSLYTDKMSLTKDNKLVSSPSRPPGIKNVLIDENDEDLDNNYRNQSNAGQQKCHTNATNAAKKEITDSNEDNFDWDNFASKYLKNTEIERKTPSKSEKRSEGNISTKAEKMQNHTTREHDFDWSSMVDRQSSMTELDEIAPPKKKTPTKMDGSAVNLIMGKDSNRHDPYICGLSEDFTQKPSNKVSKGFAKMNSNAALDDFSEPPKFNDFAEPPKFVSRSLNNNFTASNTNNTIKDASHIANPEPFRKAMNDISCDFSNKSSQSQVKQTNTDIINKATKKDINEIREDVAKKPSLKKLDTTKIHKVVKTPTEQVVRSRNSSGGSRSSMSTPTPPSSAEIGGVYSFKGSGHQSKLQNTHGSSEHMFKLPNLPPRLERKYQEQSQQNHKYVPPYKRNSASMFTTSNPSCVKQSEDWDAEADDFAEPFYLKTGEISQVTMKRKVDPLPFRGQATMENKENIRGNFNKPPSNRPISQRSADLCDIPAPKMPKIDSMEKPEQEKPKEENPEEEQEDWCEVTTKRKRHKSKEQPPVNPAKNTSQPTSNSSKQQKMSNFEKLVDRLLQEFPGCNRQSVIEAVTKIRTQRGSLSGLSMENIIERAHSFLDVKKKKHIPGLPQPQNTKQSQSNNVLMLPEFMLKPSYNPQPPTQKHVMQLPRYTPSMISKNGYEDEEEICVICHDALNMMETKKLDCNHVYHSKCISQWVERERTCPTCRQHALFPEDFPRLGK